MNDTFLRKTRLLDTDHPALQALVHERRWAELPMGEHIGAVYAFVRDEIAFGYNATDDLRASAVLEEGYGQCNTKATLLMGLLRANGVPCRLRGGTIHKRLQKGVVQGLFYALAPAEILHTWVEVHHGGHWVGLEGVILDVAYLDGVRAAHPGARGAFLGYGVGTERLEAPPITWKGSDTFIQATGLARDLGVFDDPDQFYAAQGTNLGGLRRLVFQGWVRRAMNRKVASLRGARAGEVAGLSFSPCAEDVEAT